MGADEDNALVVVQQQIIQRVTQVEADVRIVTHETAQIRTVVERQTSILDAIGKQLNLDEQTVIAIKERTDQHAKTIEHLQANEVDNSKIINRHDHEIASMQQEWKAFSTTAINALKWFLTVAGSLIIGAIFAHFVH